MILYTDKIPDTPEGCVFSDTADGVSHCKLQHDKLCGISHIPPGINGRERELWCHCLRVLPGTEGMA